MFFFFLRKYMCIVLINIALYIYIALNIALYIALYIYMCVCIYK